MTPLPARLDPTAPLVVWRVDAERHAPSWDSGIGAEIVGGRWNPKGVKAVYCSVDPSTCLVETAVHRGFKVLDSQPHVLTSLEITEVDAVHVVMPEQVPNPAWLEGGTPSKHQQRWGAALLMTTGSCSFRVRFRKTAGTSFLRQWLRPAAMRCAHKGVFRSTHD